MTLVCAVKTSAKSNRYESSSGGRIPIVRSGSQSTIAVPPGGALSIAVAMRRSSNQGPPGNFEREDEPFPQQYSSPLVVAPHV